MSKVKTFKRDDVLDASVQVFWQKGFADTSIQDLEAATTLKKSSLYAEFQNKENLFLSSLEHYSKTTYGAGILELRPLGWHNIEHFLKVRSTPRSGETGCFIIYAMREHCTFSPRMQRYLEERVDHIQASFLKNIAAEKTIREPAQIAEILMTFFVGLAFNDNLRSVGITALNPIDELLTALKSM